MNKKIQHYKNVKQVNILNIILVAGTVLTCEKMHEQCCNIHKKENRHANKNVEFMVNEQPRHLIITNLGLILFNSVLNEGICE